MRVVERASDIDQQWHERRVRDRAAVDESSTERLTVDISHGEEHMAAQFIGAVDRYDVGVRERSRGASLAQEPLANGGVALEVRRQDFDRDRAIELQISRAVHDAHPTAADLALEGVLILQRLGELDHVGSHR